jgi:hypothetical protein
VKRISEVRRLERERDAIIAARRHAEATVTDEDIRRGRLRIRRSIRIAGTAGGAATAD